MDHCLHLASHQFAAIALFHVAKFLCFWGKFVRTLWCCSITSWIRCFVRERYISRGKVGRVLNFMSSSAVVANVWFLDVFTPLSMMTYGSYFGNTMYASPRLFTYKVITDLPFNPSSRNPLMKSNHTHRLFHHYLHWLHWIHQMSPWPQPTIPSPPQIAQKHPPTPKNSISTNSYSVLAQSISEKNWCLRIQAKRAHVFSTYQAQSTPEPLNPQYGSSISEQTPRFSRLRSRRIFSGYQCIWTCLLYGNIFLFPETRNSAAFKGWTK